MKLRKRWILRKSRKLRKLRFKEFYQINNIMTLLLFSIMFSLNFINLSGQQMLTPCMLENELINFCFQQKCFCILSTFHSKILFAMSVIDTYIFLNLVIIGPQH